MKLTSTIVLVALMMGLAACSDPASGESPADQSDDTSEDIEACRSDGGPYGDGWQWMNPLPQGNPLTAIWGSEEDMVWAGGRAGTLLARDGSSWAHHLDEHLQPPGAPEYPAVTDIWGSSKDDVWMTVRGGEAAGGILHFDGERWSSEDVWFFPTAITGIDTGERWVAGSGGTVAYFDGDQWEESEVASDSGIDLLDIFAISAEDVLAVGEQGEVRRFDGSRWNRERVGTSADLAAAWAFGSDDIWVAGDDGVFHWDGDAWAEQNPAEEDSFSPEALWGSPQGVLYAADHQTVYRWTSDAQWERVGDGPAGGPITGLWGPGDGTLFAATHAGFVSSFDGQTWNYELQTSDPLHGVAELPDANMLIVDFAGKTSQWANGQLEDEDIPGRVRDVWTSTDGDIWVASEDDVVHSWDGSEWTEHAVGHGADARYYTAIWGRSSSDVWVVGNDGLAGHWNGSSWQTHTLEVDADLAAVAGSTEGNAVWITSRDGEVARWNGTEWTRFDVSRSDVDRTSGINALCVSPDGTVWIGGSSVRNLGSSVGRFDGEDWESFELEGLSIAQAVVCDDPEDVVVAGAGEPIYHFDGQDWSPDDQHVVAGINDMLRASDDSLWIVGAGGAILRHCKP